MNVLAYLTTGDGLRTVAIVLLATAQALHFRAHRLTEARARHPRPLPATERTR